MQKTAAELELSLRQRLICAGVFPGNGLAFAADFTRMLLRGTVGEWEELQRRRPALIAAVARHTPVGEDGAARVVEIASDPAFRGFVERRERDAFVLRFGEANWQRFETRLMAEVDLGDFGERYGADATVALVDAMLSVVVENEMVSPPQLRRVESAAAELGVDPAIVCYLLRRYDDRHRAGTLRFPLSPRMRIGHTPGADVVLVDPQHTPLRAELTLEEETWWIRDTGSGRPTILNGQPIQRERFKEGDELRLGSYSLRLDLEQRELVGYSDWEPGPLSVRGLCRKIGTTSLLDDLSFTAFRGEVIAVVGPSGAGKTTLLQAIVGTAPADQGEVSYDGQPFHRLLARDRSLVGVVPQDDIVHPELTVEESLLFGARLRLGARMEATELEGEVERVLEELGIHGIRHSRIGDALNRGISGGQRKRVNLGQELLTRSTRVLFLDEPTSGLDPRAAGDIVRLVRQLADRGRIVFLVTHDLSSPVMAQVDHLLVLAPGGRLAWFGPPREACSYFGVPSPDAIFHHFHRKTPEEWGEAFKGSAAYRSYVTLRERLLDREPSARAAAPAFPLTPTTAFAQFRTLVERYARVKSRDRSGNLVLLAQPPVLALVLAVVFPKPTPSMLFVLSLSCLWFGMSSAVRELIADRVIWNRERRAGVGVIPYVGSKMMVLSALTLVQCLVLTLAVVAIHDLPAYDFPTLQLCAVTGLTGLVGMSLGLCMSALFRSSEGAVGTLPLLLIPQIALSGLLVNLRNMGDVARSLANFNPQRYAYDAVLKVGERIAEQPRYGGPWKEPVGMGGVLYELGFKGSEAADTGLTLPMLAGIMFGFFMLFTGVTVRRVWERR